MASKMWIEPYYRVAYGKLQTVCGHWRRKPHKRKSATVVPLLPPVA